MSREPTPEEREQVGRCAYTMLVLCGTTAFICGLYANSACEFANREITLADDQGDFLQKYCDYLDGQNFPKDTCLTLFDDHGVGFYYWMGTIPVDTQVCFSYTLQTPWGFVTPNFDTNFVAAGVFAVLANICGAFAWFTFCFSSCCPIDQERLKGLAVYYFFACLFQGLSLLMFQSDVCSVGFFGQYFIDDELRNEFYEAVDEVNCGMGVGSKLAVAATVLYFFANGFAPIAIAPQPAGYNRAATGQPGQPGQQDQTATA